MAHTLLSVLVLAAALALAEVLRHAPTPVAASVLVIVATLAAVLASRLGPLAVATGALAAVAWVVLRPLTPALAGAGFVFLALLSRTLRAPTTPLALAHSGLSIAGGGVAAWATARWLPDGFILAHTAEQLAALVISSLALGLPFLIETEDPETHALLSLAKRSRGPARARLLRAVVLRRRALGTLSLRPEEKRALHHAFDDLRRAAETVLDTGLPLGSDRGASMRTLAETLGHRLRAIGRAVRALTLADAEERRLEAHASDAADVAREHAEARREALRALSEG